MVNTTRRTPRRIQQPPSDLRNPCESDGSADICDTSWQTSPATKRSQQPQASVVHGRRKSTAGGRSELQNPSATTETRSERAQSMSPQAVPNRFAAFNFLRRARSTRWLSTKWRESSNRPSPASASSWKASMGSFPRLVSHALSLELLEPLHKGKFAKMEFSTGTRSRINAAARSSAAFAGDEGLLTGAASLGRVFKYKVCKST